MENRKRIIVFFFFGILLILLGILILVLAPGLISNIRHQKLAILPQNPGFALWRDLDIPIYQNFHMFNIKNPDAMKSGAKPIVEDIGPFVFRAKVSKRDLKWSKDQTQVSFWEQKQFMFQRNLSKYDLNTTITILNIPLLTVFKQINIMVPPLLRPLVKFIINRLQVDLFVTGTVEELLFKGKHNDIQCLIHEILPDKVPDCDFCLMKNQNNSFSGLYEVFTGYQDVNKLSSLITYNGSDKLNFWDGEPCNEIFGSSNGELFPPADQFGSIKQYALFRPEFCRVFNLTLIETKIRSDVGTLMTDRFRPDPNSFMNASQYPPNACYRPKSVKIDMDEHSQRKTIKSILKFFNISESSFELFQANFKDDHGKQPNELDEKPSGVFDLSPCQLGAPIYLSYPHFYEADEYYLKQVDGLHPNKSQHQSYLDIEPSTGTPVDFIARIQANVDLQTAGTREPKMRSLMLPVMWQEFSIHITQQIADQIESLTKTPSITADTISILILIIGLLMFFYAIIVLLIHINQQRRRESMLSNALSDSNDPLIDSAAETNNYQSTTTADSKSPNNNQNGN